MVSRHYEAGETVLHENDDEAQTFFIITEGVVHVVATTSEGNNAILAVLKKGDFFGEMSFLDGEPRSASVIASPEAGCELVLLYRHVFLGIVKQHPQISIQLLAEMSRRLRRANRHIGTLSLMSVYGRVADVLLRIAGEQGIREGRYRVIPVRPSQQVIADMACTTRETVLRILSQLQKKHYIAMDKKRLIILNEEDLCG
jgi:CRP/FNR family transcriptional regulator/CRP/FNR family cyclic AMP-dependent transcriptional regulator